MLPKKYRLSREEFKQVMKDGRMVQGKTMGMLQVKSENLKVKSLFPKAGIIVSKKLSNKAVMRNKLKRRLRAALQIVLPEVEKELHFVILPNRRALTATVEELKEEITLIISPKSHRETPAGVVAI